MAADDPPPPIPTCERRPCTRSAAELVASCIAASRTSGKVVIATRTFPSEDYLFSYNDYDVSIACAKLNILGYGVDTRVIMDSHCSKMVLCVERLIQRSRSVQAERVVSNKTGESK
jgi:hypothetical protein